MSWALSIRWRKRKKRREQEREQGRGCRKGVKEEIKSGIRQENIEKNREELSLSLERDMLALPSSLSFLISLKERRSMECKRTLILTLAKVSGDASACALYPAGRFGIDVHAGCRLAPSPLLLRREYLAEHCCSVFSKRKAGERHRAA